jgi:hypothetical protein
MVPTIRTLDCSSRFGSKIRNLMESAEYKQIFGDVRLREDSKARGRWKQIRVGSTLLPV